MRNVFFSKFSLSYQCYFASLAFSDPATWFIIHRGQWSRSLPFTVWVMYLGVWVVGAININREQWFGVHQPSSKWKHTMSKARQLEIWALGTNSCCLAWEMYGNTLRLTCLGPPSGRWAPAENRSLILCCQDPSPLPEFMWDIRGGCRKGGMVTVTSTRSQEGVVTKRKAHCVSGYKTQEPMTFLLLTATCVSQYAWSKTVAQTRKVMCPVAARITTVV